MYSCFDQFESWLWSPLPCPALAHIQTCFTLKLNDDYRENEEDVNKKSNNNNSIEERNSTFCLLLLLVQAT